MPETIIKMPTWRCPTCDYSQDFEPTQELMNIHIAAIAVKENECPSCALRGIRNVLLVKETDPAKKTVVVIMAEEDVSNLKIEETDANGDFVIEEVAGKKRVKMRALTAAEETTKKKEVQDQITYWRTKEEV